MAPDTGAVIRPAKSADIPALARLATATFTETFGQLYAPEDLTAFLAEARTESAYARLLSDPEVFVCLATEQGGVPIGYVVAGGCKLPVENLEPAAGEIRELYVRADQHNRRLGSRLLTSALEWLAARRRSPVYVGVWSGNTGAQRLYGRFGFEKVGEYDFPVGRQMDRELILRRSLLPAQ